MLDWWVTQWINYGYDSRDVIMFQMIWLSTGILHRVHRALVIVLTTSYDPQSLLQSKRLPRSWYNACIRAHLQLRSVNKYVYFYPCLIYIRNDSTWITVKLSRIRRSVINYPGLWKKCQKILHFYPVSRMLGLQILTLILWVGQKIQVRTLKSNGSNRRTSLTMLWSTQSPLLSADCR